MRLSKLEFESNETGQALIFAFLLALLRSISLLMVILFMALLPPQPFSHLPTHGIILSGFPPNLCTAFAKKSLLFVPGGWGTRTHKSP